MAQHFSANLTVQLRQFLERWGWNFTESGGVFPPVRQEVLPVLNLGDFAGFGSSLVLPIYSVRLVGVAVAAIFPVAELAVNGNSITILDAWTVGAAANARAFLNTQSQITANLAAVAPAGLARGGAITTTGAVGTTAAARPVQAIELGMPNSAYGGRGPFAGMELRNGELLIAQGGTANSNIELNVVFTENDPTV